MDIATLTGTPGETLAGASLRTGLSRSTLRRRLSRPGLWTLEEIESTARAYGIDSIELVVRIKAYAAKAAA